MAKKKPTVKRLSSDELWNIGAEWAVKIRAAGLAQKYISAMDLYFDSGDDESGYDPYRIQYPLDVADRAGVTVALSDLLDEVGIMDPEARGKVYVAVARSAASHLG